MQFAVWLENRDALVSAHSENPFDSTVLLVLADWLEEQGESDFGAAIRHLITGHDEKELKNWHSKAADLLNAIYKSLHGKVEFVSSNTDAFKIGRFTYRVSHTSTGKVISRYIYGQNDIPVPPSKWTDTLVKAALFVILRHLHAFRVSLVSGQDITLRKRSSSLLERNLYARFNHLAHRIDHWILRVERSREYRRRMLLSRELQQELAEINNDSAQVSYLLPDVYKKINPRDFAPQINELITLIQRIGQIYGDWRPANLNQLVGDLRYWLRNSPLAQ